jgi:hypothetical protein
MRPSKSVSPYSRSSGPGTAGRPSRPRSRMRSRRRHVRRWSWSGGLAHGGALAAGASGRARARPSATAHGAGNLAPGGAVHRRQADVRGLRESAPGVHAASSPVHRPAKPAARGDAECADPASPAAPMTLHRRTACRPWPPPAPAPPSPALRAGRAGARGLRHGRTGPWTVGAQTSQEPELPAVGRAAERRRRAERQGQQAADRAGQQRRPQRHRDLRAHLREADGQRQGRPDPAALGQQRQLRRRAAGQPLRLPVPGAHRAEPPAHRDEAAVLLPDAAAAQADDGRAGRHAQGQRREDRGRGLRRRPVRPGELRRAQGGGAGQRHQMVEDKSYPPA